MSKIARIAATIFAILAKIGRKFFSRFKSNWSQSEIEDHCRRSSCCGCFGVKGLVGMAGLVRVVAEGVLVNGDI
jgi:hypothetical protein